MALFAAIDSALQTARSSCRLSGAFDAWKRRHHALSFFGDVDDFIDWWRDAGVPKDRISSDALKALCIEATHQSRDPGRNNGATPSQAEDAALLLLGVLVPKLRSWIRDAEIPAALDQDEAEAEIAAGLWEAIATTTASHSGTASRLMNAARRRVRGAARREIAHERFCRDLPPAVYLSLGGAGQPEDLIERAVEHEIVNLLEADLILSIRLHNDSIREAAWRHRLTPKAVEHRLVRAEARLLAWANGQPVPTRFAVTRHRPVLGSVSSDVSGLRETDTEKRATGDGEEVISVSSVGESLRRPGATSRPAHETGDEHGSG